MTADTTNERESERSRRLRGAVLRDRRLRLAALGGLIWIAAFTVANGLVGGTPTGHEVIGDGVYLVPIAFAVVLTAIAGSRARTRRTRGFWRLLAASNALWLAGELIWGFSAVVLGREIPFPSVADGFYLASYALVLPAIVVGFAGKLGLRAGRSLLDASIMVGAVGMTGWTWLISPQLARGASLATATGVAYPLLGVAILMMLATLAFGAHRGVPLSIVLVACAFGISALTDAGYTFAVVLHGYVPEHWLNVGWQIEAVLLALAALVVVVHDEGEPRNEVVARDVGLPIVLCGLGLVAAVALVDGPRPRNLALLGFAALIVLARLALTARENAALARELGRALDEQRRLAVSDALTGLRNRRFFEEILALEVERARRTQRPIALLVVDLDRFKRINDGHGHQAGDRVLVDAARRLSSVVRDMDVVARYGGEEFVLVLPELDPDLLGESAERCRRAIAGQPFPLPDGAELVVTASVGAASFPMHGTSAEELVRVADAALYRAKEHGRNRVEIGEAQPGDVVALGGGRVLAYLQDLADYVDARQGSAGHSLLVARLAGDVADELGLDDDARWRCVTGARLHDVGKLAVPDTILAKPRPLDQDEWLLVRAHPEEGADLVGRAPELVDVARVVREHHERFDGSGYPAGMCGDEITLEARIVAVCDAWATMSAGRPYKLPLSPEQATAELERASGEQFDPLVVRALLAVALRGADSAFADAA